jgi:hypothetical protein
VTLATGAPAMATYVRLRPPSGSDLPYLASIADVDPLFGRWRFYGSSINPATLLSSLFDNSLYHFVADDITEGAPLAYMSCYGASLRDGWAYLMFATPDLPAMRSRAFGAWILFVDYLLNTWPFRQLYLEMDERRLKDFGSITTETADVVAQIPARRFNGSEYNTEYLLCITRERWRSFRPPSVRITRRLDPVFESARLQDILQIETFSRLLSEVSGRETMGLSPPQSTLAEEFGYDMFLCGLLGVLIQEICCSPGLRSLAFWPSMTISDAYEIYCTCASAPASIAIE